MDHGRIIAIRSAFFPGTYLRMDAQGMPSAAASGGGIVNCQSFVGPWEKFRVHREGEHLISFESLAFPGVFLRLDGAGVEGDRAGGVVNCQFGCGPYERFTLLHQAGGKVAIASTAFAGMFLRMDASGLAKGGEGGVVNAQLGLGPWTVFDLVAAE